MNNQEPTFTNKHLYHLAIWAIGHFYRLFIDFIYNETDMEWTKIYALQAETIEEKLEQVEVVNDMALALVKRKCQSSPWGR